MNKIPGKPETQPDDPIQVVASEKPQQKPAEEIQFDAETGKPVQAEPNQTSFSAEDLKKLEARLEYQRRQDKKELMDALSRLQSTPAPAQPAEKSNLETKTKYGLDKNYLNQMGQTDWTRPVEEIAETIADKRAEEKFKSLMEKEQTRQREELSKQNTINQLERSKQWVLDRTPTLNDESSEEFKGFYQTYNTLLQEDPSLISNPHAPKIVWTEWQERSKATQTPTNLEAERLKRVAAGASPQGRPVQASRKTYSLTQEEIDMCKEKNLSPAVYAQMKELGPTGFKEGITA